MFDNIVMITTRSITVLLLLFLAGKALCQPASQTVLHEKIRTGGPDTNRIRSLINAGERYLKEGRFPAAKACFHEVTDDYRSRGNKRDEADTWCRFADHIPRTSMRFIDEALLGYASAEKLYRALGDTMAEVNCYEGIGFSNLRGKDLDTMEHRLKELYDTLKTRRSPFTCYIYDDLINVYEWKNDLRAIFFYSMEMLKSIEESKDSIGKLVTYMGTARAYFMNGMYPQSLGCFRKEWSALHWSNVPDFVTKLYFYYTAYSISRLLVMKDSAREARQFMEDVSRMFPPRDGKDKMLESMSYGLIYQALKEYTLAGAAFDQLGNMLDQAFQMELNNENTINFGGAYISICKFYVLREQYRKADTYFRKIPPIVRVAAHPDVKLDYEQVGSQIDSALGKWPGALRHFERYRKLSDTLFSRDKNRQILELQLNYETAQKEQSMRLQSSQIALLTRQNQLQKAQAENSRLFRNLMIGGIVACCCSSACWETATC